MHDTNWFEIQGLPSIFIATDAFIHASAVNAEIVGSPGLRRVYVPHPVQGQTPAEIWAKADRILDEAIEMLLRPAD